jgi:hypothetical protein
MSLDEYMCSYEVKIIKKSNNLSKQTDFITSTLSFEQN